MLTTKEELQALVRQFSKAMLKPGDFHEELAPAVMGLSDLLEANFGLVDDDSKRAHIKTAYGNAIGTFWAAKCSREVLRTQRFARALYGAVSEVLSLHKKTVHVLYAGTGPFATLALPAMMMFKPDEVQFTFLEINPESIEILKQVIDALELHAYIKDIHQCDATLWNVPSSEIDIVISETMYKALKVEPQVAIMLNLASQLPKETIFLPEEITVSLSKWPSFKEEPEMLAELMRFNKSLMYSIISNSSGRNWVFEDRPVQVNLSEKEQLYYTTDIRVSEGNELNWNESSLNLPEKAIVADKSGIRNMNCQYYLQDVPGFRIRL
ncbi:hypothetical protein SAMN05421788_107123 [Filimonas lacunae]|uniref:Uncharacterized protein n=1 Tax=Filimonas lacunae TaxID=477680 RepID=A0A173MFR0_9BACT|nr:hypothetical protein [Filimonas lacunae]BAV06462.1 glutamate synthase [NADPH] large chain [Filimonas lacunae]SIT27051.1 hypothetical protein SAMN05421788_107123 [Filimonas lacunae]